MKKYKLEFKNITDLTNQYSQILKAHEDRCDALKSELDKKNIPYIPLSSTGVAIEWKLISSFKNILKTGKQYVDDVYAKFDIA